MPTARSIYAMKNDGEKIRRLITVLRGPGGCAWDRRQTLRTLAPLLIEEAYEVVDAIERKSPRMFNEEIGDLLFLVMTLFACAEDTDWARYRSVIARTARKYITQHPHVFEARRNMTPGQILAAWEKRKAASGNPFDRVPKSLPALYQAKRIYDKAHRLGLLDVRPRRPEKDARAGGRKLLGMVRAAAGQGVDLETALRAEIRALRRRLGGRAARTGGRRR